MRGFGKVLLEQEQARDTCKVTLHRVGVQGPRFVGWAFEGVLVGLNHGLEETGDSRQDVDAIQIHQGHPKVWRVQYLQGEPLSRIFLTDIIHVGRLPIMIVA